MKNKIVLEHKRLNNMFDSMSFFIKNSQNSNVTKCSINLMAKQLKEHFEFEENIILKYDSMNYLYLKNKHDELIKELYAITNKDSFYEFLKLMEIHDKDVDIPLFKNIINKN